MSYPQQVLDRAAAIFIGVFGRYGSLEVLADVWRYTVQKWQQTGNGVDYLPILFETECRDLLWRRINGMT